MEDDLVAAGRYARIRTVGRQTGEPRDVTVGFAASESGVAGALVVAAGEPAADWALNLLAEPQCTVRVGDVAFEAVAEPLDGPDHARAIRSLILRYGTSAEGLGRGPSFRLDPAATLPAAGEPG
jgi:deazaflavin-dependent oxidoreductase (nitroreductase family)